MTQGEAPVPFDQPRILTLSEWQESAGPLVARLIVDDPPKIFSDVLPHRMILFPWFDPPPYHVLHAVGEAARVIGDKGMFRSYYIPDDAPYAYIPLDDLDAFYESEQSIFDSPMDLISPSARWIISTSDFDYASVGAAEHAFIDTLKQHVAGEGHDWEPYAVSRPEGRWTLDRPLAPDEQVLAWISYQRFMFPGDEENVRQQLEHFYGDAAEQLLTASAAGKHGRVERRTPEL